MKNYLNSKLSKLICTCILAILLPWDSHAQTSGTDDTYYAFPIQQGKQNYMSGTMGEIRATHIHSGIDIKTNGVVGYPVYAPADGYVSRLKISTGGYGNALYLLHPDGKTTVYAHLNEYEDKLTQWIRKNQYEQETFEIELFPEKNQFFYKKGELIGYAGNSGSSSGPHLHFEIRDTYQRPLNPLDFNFKEIEDTQPPTVREIALQTLSPTSRINDQFGRSEFNLNNSGNTYTLKEPIKAFGKLGLEVQAFDRHNGSWSHNGIQHIQVFLDGERIFSQKIDRFSFAETRNVLVINNYEVYQEKRQKFFRLYRADGNEISFYDELKDRGFLHINDSTEHELKVSLKDSYENESIILLAIKGSTPVRRIPVNNLYRSETGHKLYEKHLLLYAPIKTGESNKIKIIADRRPYDVIPAYTSNQQAVYLWNMNRGIPDSAILQHSTYPFEFITAIPSNAEFNYYGKDLSIHFPKDALFDTIYLETGYKTDEGREIFKINDLTIPLRKYISVTLDTKLNYDRKFASVYYINRHGRFEYEGGNWSGDKITFGTRDLGEYTIIEDRTPPEIRAIHISKDKLEFKISDQMSGIDSYRATVGGKWILLHYDYKQDKLWGSTDDWPSPLQGELLLEVYDEQGNLNTFKSEL